MRNLRLLLFLIFSVTLFPSKPMANAPKLQNIPKQPSLHTLIIQRSMGYGVEQYSLRMQRDRWQISSNSSHFMPLSSHYPVGVASTKKNPMAKLYWDQLQHIHSKYKRVAASPEKVHGSPHDIKIWLNGKQIPPFVDDYKSLYFLATKMVTPELICEHCIKTERSKTGKTLLIENKKGVILKAPLSKRACSKHTPKRVCSTEFGFL